MHGGALVGTIDIHFGLARMNFIALCLGHISDQANDMLESLTGRRDKSLAPRLNERPQPHLTPRCNIALARVGVRWIIGKGIARKQYHRSHIVWSYPKRLKGYKPSKRKAKSNKTRRLACHKCCGRVRNAIVLGIRPYRRRMG